MKKRVLSTLFATVLIFSLAACGSKPAPAGGSASESAGAPAGGSADEAVSEAAGESVSESAGEAVSAPASVPASEAAAEAASEAATGAAAAEPLMGGWELIDQEAVTLPEDVQEAFSRISEGENKDLVPVALVAQQVVAGMNDMLLCKEGGEYRMVVIYRNLEGGAELTNSTIFPLADYTSVDGEADTEQLVGGWNVPDETTVLPLPENAQAAFSKALEGFTGSSVEAMALLGTQVVAGTNYAVLCRVTPTVPDPVSSVQVVTVYEDLEGNAIFTGFMPIDPADFNQ